MRVAGLMVLMAAAGQLWAAEPLAGRWTLTSQEIDGKKVDADPLLLRIVQRGTVLEFGYSVPVNNVYFVSMSFVSKLDGTEADVKDAKENKIGTVQVTRAGDSQYKVILQGTNRPTAVGTMKVSADGKTLTCASDSKTSDQRTVHTVQVFARH